MSKVSVTKDKLDILANAIANKSGEPLTLTLDEMVSAVDGIETGGGGITPTGNIDITQAGVTDVTNYATATVPQGDPWVMMADATFYTSGGQRKWKTYPKVEVSVGDGDTAGFIADGFSKVGDPLDTYAIASGTTITPTTNSQTIGGSNVMMEGAVTVAAMPSGTATAPTTISGTAATVSTGTNTLTLSKTVSNTPQVTAGYVASGTAGNSAVSLTANVTTKGTATITPTTTNQTIASGTYLTGTQTISGDANLIAGNIKSGTTIFGVTGTYSGGGGTLTVATKTTTLNATSQTLSFSSLSGQPKYWFLRATTNVSSSGSTTYYYVTDCFYNGTSIVGNTFRIGSTRRVQNITSGITQSYSGGTLTITAGSSSGATPGQFYGASNFGYELVYIY